MNTPTQITPLVLEGNFYQDGKIVGPIKSVFPLPLDRTHGIEENESGDTRARYLLAIRGNFTVHQGLGAEKFEVDSGSQRIRVYPEDSQSVGGESAITVTLDG